jgi:hypothetical protein
MAHFLLSVIARATKAKKIANNSTTTEAREKTSIDLEF